MSFLLPIFWSAMVLAGGLVILYLIREQPRKRRLSTLLFWEQVSSKIHETPLWRKLRRWISLLLQILFLTLLVFALARPVADWEMSGARSRVFVLDPSVSMTATDGKPSRFERAKAEIRSSIRRMRAFDEAALVIATDSPEVASGWTRSRRRLLEALERVEPVSTDTDARPALEVAKNLAATRDAAAVEFFTDGVGGISLDDDLLSGVVERRQGEESPANTGLTMFAARRSLIAPGEFTLVARTGGTGGSAEIEVLRDGTLIDAQSIEDASNWQRSWSLRNDQGGTFTARLRTSADDALAADNEASLTLAPLTAVDVVLVSPPDAFLEAVFQAMPGVNVTRVWPADRAGGGDPGKLWVFNKATPPESFASRALVLVNPQEGGFWGERLGDLKDPIISEIDEDSPLVRFASLDKVRLSKAPEFTAPVGATILASSFGSPVIYGKWDRGQRWLVLGFDLEQSDFVLRTAFPVLMENVVQSLRAGDESGMRATLPGEAESKLATAKAPAAVEGAESRGWIGPWTARPLWWWALLLGAIWLLAEWWTYHRRITE